MRLSKDSDLQLINALNKGSERAFNMLFNRYWYKAYLTAFGKVKSREDAEEIVQDFFMTLWDKKGGLKISNFSNYLQASIKYRSIDLIRSRMIEQKYWDYYKTCIPPQSDSNTGSKVEFNELMHNIDKGMVGIPEKSRKIFYLNRLEGKSIKEIARLLQLSEKAIEYHLTRTLKELKVHLKDFR